jgi:hypothetical protein
MFEEGPSIAEVRHAYAKAKKLAGSLKAQRAQEQG